MISFQDVRRVALALDGAAEADHHGIPSFRVRGRIFCTLRPAEGRMMVKLDPEDQHNLCAAHGEAISAVPGYWGRKGSTFVDLGSVTQPLACDLLRLAWSNVVYPARRRSS